MNLYDRYVLPRLIDACCGMREVQALRAELIPQARGRVLEVGIGTGRNLPFYVAGAVSALHGLDPAAQMNPAARRRANAAGLPVDWLTLSAESIPAPAASYDTVVCTFTLCSIPDPLAALREMRRVLKPDGQLLFCEHGRAPEASVQRWQDRLTPLWKPLAGGCHLNRHVPSMLRDGGFRVAQTKSAYLRGPRVMTWVVRGVAEPA